MKANELRIGNYILEKEKAKQMHSISNHNAKDYSKIKPIPLTEEWLLKFGFEKVEGMDGDYNAYDIPSWGKVSLQNGFIQSDQYYFLDGLKDNLIQHVHQLQNLYFALTGEELTLKK